MENSIAHWRKIRRVSQEKLAEAAGVSREQISKIENGVSDTTLERIERMAAKLNVHPADLLLPADAWSDDFNELRSNYLRLSEEGRKSALAMIRGLIAARSAA